MQKDASGSQDAPRAASEAAPDWPTAAQVAASDPLATDLMQGFPPAPEKRVLPQNWIQFPQVRWAVRNGRTIMPSADIPRAGPVAELPSAPRDLDAIAFTDLHGRERTVSEFLARSHVDGFIVLQHGRVLYERYPGSMQPHELHTLASVTKSVTAVLVMMLVDEGVLDLSARLAAYVPELAGTPVGEATLQQNLDMAVAIRFPEDQPYNFGYWAAAGALPRKPGAPGTVYEFIRSVGEAMPGTGSVMQYQSNSPEAVNWAMQRATGRVWHALLAERIWRHLGAEREAYTLVDPAGMPMAAGGMNVTLRDLARFGAMLCNRGYFNGRQIVPEHVVARVFAPADNHAAFASGNQAEKSANSGVRYTYRNYWYQTGGECPAFQAHGILSQYLHVAPEDGLVIAQLASTPFEGGLNLPAFNRAAIAITRALRLA